jgi:protein-tyrosine phosphatase
VAEPTVVTTGRVLVVCTANVCRSPFIERLLRLALPESIPVISAGTRALVGAPVDERVARRLRQLGADPGGFAARQLTGELVSGAHLVLTATRAHRAAVATLHPRALDYAFTLGDFSDLAAGVDVDGRHPAPSEMQWVGYVTRLAAARRGMVPPRSAAEVDIPDPYRRKDEIFDAMAQQVLGALPSVVRLLSG